MLETYNVDLYERCRAAGYDLTQRHEMGSILGHGTSNRPLLGFAKRHRLEHPKIQLELNIALGYHARAGNEKGVRLCLWAGADPHAPTPDPRFDRSEEAGERDGEEGFVGWSAIEEAASEGHLETTVEGLSAIRIRCRPQLSDGLRLADLPDVPTSPQAQTSRFVAGSPRADRAP